MFFHLAITLMHTIEQLIGTGICELRMRYLLEHPGLRQVAQVNISDCACCVLFYFTICACMSAVIVSARFKYW
jgi:hypothetical protein